MSTTQQTYTFHLDDGNCIPLVITRGRLLNSALIEDCGKDPFELIGREDELIKDFITTAILEPYHSVRHCLAPIEHLSSSSRTLTMSAGWSRLPLRRFFQMV